MANLTKLKDIGKDKILLSYVISFSLMALIAYGLLIRTDIGTFVKSRKTFGVIKQNLLTLKTIAQYKKNIIDFNQCYTVDISENKIIEIISDIAKKNSVELELVRPIQVRAVGDYRNLGVLVEGRGAYHDIAFFISDLESNERYFFIERFDLSIKRKSPSPGKSPRGKKPTERKSMPKGAELVKSDVSGASDSGKTASYEEEAAASFSLIVMCFNLKK